MARSYHINTPVILSVSEGPCWLPEEALLQTADKLFQRFARNLRAPALNMINLIMRELIVKFRTCGSNLLQLKTL